MIKKLRLKFVIYNMSIVTLMLVVIFGMVYYFTENNLEQKSLEMMRSLGFNTTSVMLPESIGQEIRLPYFSIVFEQTGEMRAVGGGYYDLTNTEFLQEVTKEAFESDKEYGVIKRYNLRFFKMNTPFYRCLTFADISSEKETLNNLIKTCIIVGIAAFLAFLGISILLSRLAVKPVEHAWKLQSQFVADASHELKTPLTVITTNVQLLEDGGQVQQDAQKYVSNIMAMSDRMKVLVGQMLELARADNINSRFVVEKVDFSLVVNDVIMPFEPVFFERGLNLKYDIADDISVYGEAEKLQQVIQILLDNAVKYSAAEADVKITLEKNKPSSCLLCVANEGEEITKEDCENIFRRFYRVDKARNDSASFGLGLSVAETIVKKYSGKIWAESAQGVNTFKVELPTAK